MEADTVEVAARAENQMKLDFSKLKNKKIKNSELTFVILDTGNIELIKKAIPNFSPIINRWIMQDDQLPIDLRYACYADLKDKKMSVRVKFTKKYIDGIIQTLSEEDFCKLLCMAINEDEISLRNLLLSAYYNAGDNENIKIPHTAVLYFLKYSSNVPINIMKIINQDQKIRKLFVIVKLKFG